MLISLQRTSQLELTRCLLLSQINPNYKHRHPLRSFMVQHIPNLTMMVMGLAMVFMIPS